MIVQAGTRSIVRATLGRFFEIVKVVYARGFVLITMVDVSTV